MLTLTCEHCQKVYQRANGDQGRGRFCSIRCARAAQPMPSLTERFLARMPSGEGCWEWPGARNGDGYGTLRSGPRGAVRQHMAHRVSWEVHFGPIPDGMLVCHHCDNPPCIRPDHLFLGTEAMNNRDRDRKGRHRVLVGDEHPQRQDPSLVFRGERHWKARLTEDDVRAIRARRAAGETLGSLSQAFGVNEAQISAICHRRQWKHVA